MAGMETDSGVMRSWAQEAGLHAEAYLDRLARCTTDEAHALSFFSDDDVAYSLFRAWLLACTAVGVMVAIGVLRGPAVVLREAGFPEVAGVTLRNPNCISKQRIFSKNACTGIYRI